MHCVLIKCQSDDETYIDSLFVLVLLGTDQSPSCVGGHSWAN